MKCYRLSFLISRILLSIDFGFKNFIKSSEYSNKFLSFFIKICSLNLKNHFFHSEKNLVLFLENQKISTNGIKILLNQKSLKRVGLVDELFDFSNFYFFTEKKKADLFEIIFNFNFYKLKKSNLLSGLMLNIPLNLIKRVKKIPSLRITMSIIKIAAKSKILLIIDGLLLLFLENPSLSSKSFTQEIIWNIFRLILNIKKHYTRLLDIRAVSFLNIHQHSLFFFSFFFRFFKLVYIRSFINFCFKNAGNFVCDINGHWLIIYIIHTVYLNKKKKLNFPFFKSLFNTTYSFSFPSQLFFIFLFRKSTKLFWENKSYATMTYFKREKNCVPLIKKLISEKKCRVIFFLSFIRLKTFKMDLKFYPNSLQNEFIKIIKIVRLYIKDNNIRDNYNKFKMPNRNKVHNFYFKRCFIFPNTIRIKNDFSGFYSIFYFIRKIYKHLLKTVLKKNQLGKNFFNLFPQNLLVGIIYNLNLVETIKLPIKFSEVPMLEKYKYLKHYENM